jgi:hypothetical protein
MYVKRLIATFSIACLIVPLLWAMPVLAKPATQDECPGNVLANPSFEEGFSERGAGEVSVANGWFPWWQDGPGQDEGYYRRPEYKPEDAARYGRRRVRSGNFAQKLFNTFSTHNAGLYQQVQVPAESTLTLSAWVQAWSSQHHDPGTVVEPGNYRVYVGIDPAGGTDWNSPNVVWSEPRIEYNTWLHLQVQAKARAGTITVFLRGQPEFRTKFNDSYWEDTCLTVQRPTPRPTAIPTDTPTPTASPTATASPTPTSTPTPAPGNICASVYEDGNSNGQRDEGEGLVAGATITLLDASRVELERYTTDGVSEPYCFVGLVAGGYILQRQNAPAYVSTDADEMVVAVAPGETTDVAFGARFAPTPTATATATATPTATPTPTPRPILDRVGSAIYGVSGIILAALALIITAGLQILRKRL